MGVTVLLQLCVIEMELIWFLIGSLISLICSIYSIYDNGNNGSIFEFSHDYDIGDQWQL